MRTLHVATSNTAEFAVCRPTVTV